MSPSSRDLVTRAKSVLQREASAIQALTEQLEGERLEEVLALMFTCEGHVLVAGAGTSNAMAQRFAHLLSCSGTPALHFSAADSLHGGAGAVTDKDVVYVISKGGRTEEINQFAEIAQQRGAKVIAQTENLESPLAQMSDATFHVVAEGDIDPYGMIATGSSLVNGAAGDVLCLLLLEKRGYSRDDFGTTHPGGAVGKKLKEAAW
jgi:arabinose-5-phosphate isomerase